MRYHQVCLESCGYTLPQEVITSDQLERQLEPLYQRLRLPEGRLELMSGIQERRFWSPEMLPSDMSIASGERAIAAGGIDRNQIGALIHGSVCRDFLEPATACRVHYHLGLPAHCVIYDVSNACLGLMNGLLQAANMIELGQIRAALVLGTESGRNLVETTIADLNRDQTLTRRQLKLSIASLTIGSGSCAILLTDRELSRSGNRLVAASARAHTAHHQLCQSERDDAVGAGMQPRMATDSEVLMEQGIATGVATFADFLSETGWTVAEIDRVFCHQVGVAHRKQMLNALAIPEGRDFVTYPWLGNTGAVALPITLALGAEQGQVQPGDKTALLGIGSGINCLMLGIHWQRSLVDGGTEQRPTAGSEALIPNGSDRDARTSSGV